MAGQFTTQTDEMRAAGQHVLDVNEQIQARLRLLDQQLGPVRDAWRGQASVAFGGLMTRWNEDAVRINNALRTIGEAIQGSGATYGATEHEATQGIGAIRGALG